MVAESTTREILITTAIMVRTDLTGEPLSESLDSIKEDLQSCLHQFASAHPEVLTSDMIQVHTLGSPETNSRRCDQCGRWASEGTAAHFIDALPDGEVVDGRFICGECGTQDYWHH